MDFLTTLVTVAIMFAYALPGFIFVKSKAIKQESIPAFARLLLYVCQPALIIYTLNRADFTLELLGQMGIFFALCTAMEIAVILLVMLIYKGHFGDVRNRICSIASSFANVGFFGVPLLEALLPNYPYAIVFSTVFSVSLNILSWTLGVGVIAWDKSKISVKKMIITPTTVALVIALPLFFTQTKIPTQIYTMVELLGKMTTPLCMLILGMRLATVNMRELFCNYRIYVSTAVKNIIYPLVSFLVVFWIPLPYYIKATFFLLGCCPSASMVLNMAELIGEGQKSAANSVLISTMACIVTIPVLSMMLHLLA